MKSPNTFFALFTTETLKKNDVFPVRLFMKEFSNNSLTPINDKLLLKQIAQKRNTSVIPVKKLELSDDDIIKHELKKM